MTPFLIEYLWKSTDQPAWRRITAYTIITKRMMCMHAPQRGRYPLSVLPLPAVESEAYQQEADLRFSLLRAFGGTADAARIAESDEARSPRMSNVLRAIEIFGTLQESSGDDYCARRDALLARWRPEEFVTVLAATACDEFLLSDLATRVSYPMLLERLDHWLNQRFLDADAPINLDEWRQKFGDLPDMDKAAVITGLIERRLKYPPDTEKMDLFMLDGIEILYSPGSSLYGLIGTIDGKKILNPVRRHGVCSNYCQLTGAKKS